MPTLNSRTRPRYDLIFVNKRRVIPVVLYTIHQSGFQFPAAHIHKTHIYHGKGYMTHPVVELSDGPVTRQEAERLIAEHASRHDGLITWEEWEKEK